MKKESFGSVVMIVLGVMCFIGVAGAEQLDQKAIEKDRLISAMLAEKKMILDNVEIEAAEVQELIDKTKSEIEKMKLIDQ